MFRWIIHARILHAKLMDQLFTCSNYPDRVFCDTATIKKDREGGYIYIIEFKQSVEKFSRYRRWLFLHYL